MSVDTHAPNQGTGQIVLRAFMFVDLVDSTQIAVDLGPMMFARVIVALGEIVHQASANLRSAERPKDKGDGFLVYFPTAAAAVEAALRVHLGLEACTGFDVRLTARIGIDVGSATIAGSEANGETKLVGEAMNLAARLEGAAAPGQVLLSARAHQDVLPFAGAIVAALAESAGRGIEFVDHGYCRFKGVPQPVQVFEAGIVGWSPFCRPERSEKAAPCASPEEEQLLAWRPQAGTAVPGAEAWVLEQALGKGRFGEVWRAHNRRLHTDRAFKFCFDPRIARSLARELAANQILSGAAAHPGIVPIEDFHLERPPAWLAVRYAPAGSLEQWWHRQTTPPSMELRLALIADIAEALGRSHQLGVLHRDIKPANILIEEREGSVRAALTDFGLAALTNSTVASAAGVSRMGESIFSSMLNISSVSGTPMYLPPELRNGRYGWSPAGDVFSLGLVLYQLLRGDFGIPIEEALEHPVADPVLAEDLRECLHALPQERTLGAAELADRLRRHAERSEARNQRLAEAAALQAAEEEARRQKVRADEQAQARIQADRERARAEQAARRLRWAMATVMGLALLAAFGYWQQHALRSRAETAELQQRQANEQARQRAEEAEQAQRRTQAVNQFVIKVLRASDPNQGGDHQLTINMAMLNAISELDAGAFQTDPQTRAQLLATIGTILINNGRVAQAEPLLRQALELEHSSTAERSEVQLALAKALRTLAKYPEAESLMAEIVKLRRDAQPQDVRGLAEAINQLALIQRSSGKPALAEDTHREALALLGQESGVDDALYASVLNDLAMVVDSLGRQAEAAPMFLESLNIRRRLYPGDNPELGASLNNYGYVMKSIGKLDDAERYFREALAMRQRLYGTNHPQIAITQSNLAGVLAMQGRFEAAGELHQQTLAMFQRLNAGDHPDTLKAMVMLSEFLAEAGQLTEAARHGAEAAAMATRLYPDGHPRMADALASLALIEFRMGQLAEARARIKAAATMVLRFQPPEGHTARGVLERQRVILGTD